MHAALQEQQRAFMIENYRQTAVLQASTALMVQAAREEKPLDPVAIARAAKRVADAIVNEVFPEG